MVPVISGLARQIAFVVAFIYIVIMNIIFSLPKNPFGGSTNTELSNLYKTNFTPAGFTFSVWGVIYFFQGVFVVYQVLPSQREEALFDNLATYLIPAYILNGIWLATFSTGKAFTTAMMLIFAYLLFLQPAYSQVLQIGLKTKLDRRIFLVNCALSTQIAWLVAANCASLGLTLRFYGWQVPGDFCAGLVFLVGLIATYVGVTRGDVAYAMVSVWALIGIISENNKALNRSAEVVQTCYGMIAFALIGLGVGLVRYYFEQRNEKSVESVEA